MRKIVALAAFSLISYLVFPTQVFASAPKAGTTCAKVGLTKTTATLKFTCIKSGKKLIWSKGVSLPLAQPITTSLQSPTRTPSVSTTPTPSPIVSAVPAPTPTPTPTKFKALIPIALPVAQDENLNFANVLNHLSEIPTIAWQKTQDVIQKNPANDVPDDFYIGPTTQYNAVGGLEDFQNVLHRTQRMWSGFAQSPYYSVFIYNAQDEPWAEDKVKEIFAKKGYGFSSADSPIQAIRGSCQPAIKVGSPVDPATVCGGAQSGSVLGSDDAFMIFAHQNSYLGDYSGTVGHEYTHSVQGAQWINSPLCSGSKKSSCFRNGFANRGFSPCWLFEGLPQATGGFAAKSNLQDFLSLRANWPFNQGATTVTDYTSASLKTYLTNQDPKTCYNFNNPAIRAAYLMGYSIGALTVEALVAIDGPQAVMALFALGAEGEDFATAFQNVYGISWDDASTILSNVLAAEYATYGPPPKPNP
jgi:hypothetical protein